MYHAADFDSPLSPDLLKMVANRAVMNEKSENLTLDLDVGPDTVRPHLLTLKEIDTFIPTWISLPYLQAILSSTV